MQATTLLRDLAVVMLAAAVTTVLLARLRFPTVLGYVLAGVLVGPHALPYSLIDDQESIRTLADLGLVLLLFSVGLDLGLPRLRRVGASAYLVALIQALLLGWLGYEVARAFGWSSLDRTFLGAALAISSTTVAMGVLRNNAASPDPVATFASGVLAIESLIAMALIAVLSSVAATGGLEPLPALEALGRLATFLVAALVLGLLVVPRLLDWVARLGQPAVLLLTVLGFCFGLSLVAVELGYSVALGAFVAGSLVAGSRLSAHIAELTASVREVFIAVFFVAVGLLLDPVLLGEQALEIALLTVVVVAGKLVGYGIGALATGHELSTATRLGLGLSQIGELSFVIAALGLGPKVTSGWLYPVVVAVSVLSSALTPFLYRRSETLARLIQRLLPERAREALRLYGQRLEPEPQSRRGMAQRHLRRLAWQLVFNAALIAGAFIAATFVADHVPEWFSTPNGDRSQTRALLWAGAALLVLPVFIDAYRKLRVLGMLIAAVSVSAGGMGRRTVVANSILFAGSVVLGLLTVLTSAPLLPHWNVLIVLIAFVAVMAFILRRSLIRIYNRAEVTVEEGLSPQPVADSDAERDLRVLLEAAEVATVTVTAASAAAGKKVAELNIRARTGASAVGIERAGAVIINPGPAESILAGDRVLLLGGRDQLQAARSLLQG